MHDLTGISLAGILFIPWCRFSDGRRVKRKFDSGDVVRSLYDYVELEFGVDPSEVLICTTMPRVSCALVQMAV